MRDTYLLCFLGAQGKGPYTHCVTIVFLTHLHVRWSSLRRPFVPLFLLELHGLALMKVVPVVHDALQLHFQDSPGGENTMTSHEERTSKASPPPFFVFTVTSAWEVCTCCPWTQPLPPCWAPALSATVCTPSDRHLLGPGDPPAPRSAPSSSASESGCARPPPSRAAQFRTSLHSVLPSSSLQI